MLYYARSDTHYLLYIYDNMRNELVDTANSETPDENLTEIVLDKSKKTSLLRYERQIYNSETGKGPGGWYGLLMKTPALFSNEQLAVFIAVHSWRDKIARLDDDSTAFIMPNHVIFSISKLMPMDMVALLGIVHPASHSVKSRSGELLDLVKEAKANGKHGPSMSDVLRSRSPGANTKENFPSTGTKSPLTPLVAIVDETHLISEQSSFWGDAFGSSIWDAPTLTEPVEDVKLAVPLPQLSSEIYVVPNSVVNKQEESTEVSSQGAQQPPPQLEDTDDTFVLKRGSKQKSNVLLSEEGPGSGSPSADYEELNPKQKSSKEDGGGSNAELRRAQKQSRREAKAAKRAAKEAAKEAADEEEPFDYSKAESVLHGKRKNEEQEGRKSKKPFDPYTKSSDAPKGMRRAQTERAGKSHTFKG